MDGLRRILHTQRARSWRRHESRSLGSISVKPVIVFGLITDARSATVLGVGTREPLCSVWTKWAPQNRVRQIVTHVSLRPRYSAAAGGLRGGLKTHSWEAKTRNLHGTHSHLHGVLVVSQLIQPGQQAFLVKHIRTGCVCLLGECKVDMQKSI